MDKKQKISWGVSFGSLALVAGMVSYLGLSNGDRSDNQMALNRGQQPGNNPNQQTQDSFNSQQGQGTGENNDNPWGGGRSSQFNQNDQGFGNNFDNGGQSFGQSGHHRSFDTTTGGT
ncbi:hypothetical protein BABA_17687 [Neobacillus bataviensis LMG 21833]|uniref:Uncharacterized protein n=1 Tax=Neobacillus bataviensis LMG 21833 TaxID=1117379 RepID=K6DCK5_9BACI|nr:hypothetical protein [Neobacillus bataviensis]EKN65999.1 hypothetical protein BABA_17687 [Neobacillus bataviensis LMG 21833]